MRIIAIMKTFAQLRLLLPPQAGEGWDEGTVMAIRYLMIQGVSCHGRWNGITKILSRRMKYVRIPAGRKIAMQAVK